MSNNLSLKCQRFTLSGWKDIGIRIFDFVANTQFLLAKFFFFNVYETKVVKVWIVKGAVVNQWGNCCILLRIYCCESMTKLLYIVENILLWINKKIVVYCWEYTVVNQWGNCCIL